MLSYWSLTSTLTWTNCTVSISLSDCQLFKAVLKDPVCWQRRLLLFALWAHWSAAQRTNHHFSLTSRADWTSQTHTDSERTVLSTRLSTYSEELWRQVKLVNGRHIVSCSESTDPNVQNKTRTSLTSRFHQICVHCVTTPPHQQSRYFMLQVRCAPSSSDSPEPSGTDTQDFYFWRMPEHDAAVQLNFTPSRQKVTETTMWHLVTFQNKTLYVHTSTQISKKRQTQALLLILRSGTLPVSPLTSYFLPWLPVLLPDFQLSLSKTKVQKRMMWCEC